jgi:N-acetylglucosaminyl-diphospho-decaprenol L-rhamnosyltransferase
VSQGARVSAVVVSFNTREETLACLRSLAGNPGLETILVDNASSDGSPEAVRSAFPEVRFLENAENRGFAAAVNRALQEVHSPFVLLLNSDALLQPGALQALLEFLEAHPEVGVVAPRLVGPMGTELSFGPRPTLLSEWHQRRLVRGAQRGNAVVTAEVETLAQREMDPAWVSGACFLARREALAVVGGFDDGFFLYQEDVDLCLRLRKAGWRIAFFPGAEVFHQRGRSMRVTPSRSRLEYHRSHIRLYRKHNSLLSTLVLRFLLVTRGGIGFLAAPTPELRAEARALLRLALWG